MENKRFIYIDIERRGKLDRLEQQIQFLLELDQLKEIKRQTFIASGMRQENDAEHSWSLALMCLLFQEYANRPIDILKTVAMVLVHDVVEIDAGDTYAYDDVGNATKVEREQKAAERIFQMLPEDQAKRFRTLWEEFEAGQTAEAQYAMTMDKVQPLLLNDRTDGKMWRTHQVTKSQILKRNEHTGDGALALWEYARKKIEENIQKGNIRDE